MLVPKFYSYYEWQAHSRTDCERCEGDGLIDCADCRVVKPEYENCGACKGNMKLKCPVCFEVYLNCKARDQQKWINWHEQ